jgi:hypothetical protein
MPQRASLLLDNLTPKVFLRRQRIVRPATQRQVGRTVLATPSERLQMMQLQPARLPTPLPACI